MSKGAELASWEAILAANEGAMIDFLIGSLGMPRTLAFEFIKRLSLYNEALIKVMQLRKSKGKNKTWQSQES